VRFKGDAAELVEGGGFLCGLCAPWLGNGDEVLEGKEEQGEVMRVFGRWKTMVFCREG
jgi:hypothetical protein